MSLIVGENPARRQAGVGTGILMWHGRQIREVQDRMKNGKELLFGGPYVKASGDKGKSETLPQYKVNS